MNGRTITAVAMAGVGLAAATGVMTTLVTSDKPVTKNHSAPPLEVLGALGVMWGAAAGALAGGLALYGVFASHSFGNFSKAATVLAAGAGVAGGIYGGIQLGNKLGD